jgi:hypothetical protein
MTKDTDIMDTLNNSYCCRSEEATNSQRNDSTTPLNVVKLWGSRAVALIPVNIWGEMAAKKPGACYFVIAALQRQHPKRITSFHVSNNLKFFRPPLSYELTYLSNWHYLAVSSQSTSG